MIRLQTALRSPTWLTFIAGMVGLGAQQVFPTSAFWTYFFWACAALFVGTMVVTGFQHRPKRSSAENLTRISPTLRPPSVERASRELNLQEAFQLVCARMGQSPSGDSDPAEIDRRLNVFATLRQQARDGVLKVRGRPKALGFLSTNKPREEIPADHWRNMGFDSVRYIFGESEDFIRATETVPDVDSDHSNTAPYYDLTVLESQLKDLWQAKQPAPQLTFLSAAEFLAAAQKYGWNFSDPSLDAIRLQRGLQEAALHGRIKIYGRVNKNSEKLTAMGARVTIPTEFWKEGWLQLLAALPFGEIGGRTFGTEAYVPGASAVAYKDIHFDLEGLDWLRSESSAYRGLEV